jgi:hypothetical protein
MFLSQRLCCKALLRLRSATSARWVEHLIKILLRIEFGVFVVSIGFPCNQKANDGTEKGSRT